MLILNGDDVRTVFRMRDAIALMSETMVLFTEGHAYQPKDMLLQPPALGGVAVLKPAHVAGSHPAFGFKSATLFPGNVDRGLDAVQGFVVLLDQETGVPLALVEGGAVTELRTGAVSAVATDLLARRGAADLAIIGAGGQARAHLTAMGEIRDLRRVRIWNRSRPRAEQLQAWGAQRGFRVEVMDSVRATVDGADIVCTVTASHEPLVEGRWLAPGTHVNAIGAFQPNTRELHSDAVERADVIVVDSREAALAKAGDLLIPLDEGKLDGFAPLELGELVAGAPGGRQSPNDVTIFKSVGLAVQDLASAAFAYGRGRGQGLGHEVAFP